MSSKIKSKLISLAGALLVLAIFYIFNPEARDFSSFNDNIRRTLAINNCSKSAHSTSSGQATSTSHVLQVIDGDTIEILTTACGVERVRMIGINTPESVDPRRPIQCFGLEASHKAKEMLSDKDVMIKNDPTQDERDKYGRLLAYVFLQDGALFNQYMLQEGYAYEYTYLLPYQHQKEFKEAEASAKAGQKGLWSPATCDGKK